MFLAEAREADVADRMIVDAAGRHVEIEDELVVLSGRVTGQGREPRGSWKSFTPPTENPDTVPKPLRFAQLRTRDGPSNAVWSSFVVRANELP